VLATERDVVALVVRVVLAQQVMGHHLRKSANFLVGEVLTHGGQLQGKTLSNGGANVLQGAYSITCSTNISETDVTSDFEITHFSHWRNSNGW